MKKIAILLVSVLFVINQAFASDIEELTDSWTRNSSAGLIGDNETGEMEGEGDILFSTPVCDSIWVLLALAGSFYLFGKRKKESRRMEEEHSES